jgi:hypothetical protein
MRLLFLLCTLVILGGCDGNPFAKWKTEKESKKLVVESLKDGESAKFQNVNGECGEVNAKNAFGAYTGFKRYMTLQGEGPFFEEAEPSLVFEGIWAKECTDAASKVDLKECATYARNAESLFHGYAISQSYDKNEYDNRYERGLNKLKGKYPKQYEALQTLPKKVIAAYQIAEKDDIEKAGVNFSTEMFKECASGELPIFKL